MNFAEFFHQIAVMQTECAARFLTWLLDESNLFGDLQERQRTWPEREREREAWKTAYDQWFMQIRLEGHPADEADRQTRDMLTTLGLHEFA